MPYFSVDDLDIDVDDFFWEMSSKEKDEMFNLLIAGGYSTAGPVSETGSLLEEEFVKTIDTIAKNRLQLTSEEDNLLRRIASRF